MRISPSRRHNQANQGWNLVQFRAVRNPQLASVELRVQRSERHHLFVMLWTRLDVSLSERVQALHELAARLRGPLMARVGEGRGWRKGT